VESLPPLNGATVNQLAAAIHRLARGASLATGTFTVEIGTTETTVTDGNMTADAIPFVFPLDATAADIMAGRPSGITTLNIAASTTSSNFNDSRISSGDAVILLPSTSSGSQVAHANDAPMYTSTSGGVLQVNHVSQAATPEYSYVVVKNGPSLYVKTRFDGSFVVGHASWGATGTFGYVILGA
jgi:hypothetical protein